MLFKKPPPKSLPVPQEYSWNDEKRIAQSISININDWQYKVFPSLRTQSFGSWMFQFEGHATTDPIKGLTVSGDIQVLDPPDEPPPMLQDRWKSVPDNVEGYCFFMDMGDRTILPSVGTTLYCQQSAIDWIYRAFSIGAQSRTGGISIELQVDGPNNEGENFWRDRWRDEWLRVVSWKLFSGSQLKSPLTGAEK
jgi:hypothetical protein